MRIFFAYTCFLYDECCLDQSESAIKAQHHSTDITVNPVHCKANLVTERGGLYLQAKTLGPTLDMRRHGMHALMFDMQNILSSVRQTSMCIIEWMLRIRNKRYMDDK